MRTLSGHRISNIGIGTWTLSRAPIETEVPTLLYYYYHGVNFIDVVLAYDGGKTLKVVAEFLKHIHRKNIFINAFITYGCNTVDDIEKQIDTYLKELNIKYIDCLTLHSPAVIGISFDEYVKKVNELRQTNKFYHIGYSNLSPEQFEKVKNNAQYFEGLYNLDCKINEDNGIMDKCKKLGIPFYAYQPLRRNRIALANHKEVVLLAKKHKKTQNQILLNWMLKHKKINVLIKSTNTEHIAENIKANDFEMTLADYKMLDKFRNEFFDNIPVTFGNEEGKVRIDQLPNQG